MRVMAEGPPVFFRLTYPGRRKCESQPDQRKQIDARPVPILGRKTRESVKSLLRWSATLFLFHHALQGMLVLARKIHHLCHLRFSDLIGKNATLPDAMVMDVQHDLGRGLSVLLEEFFQYVNNKLHRSVVIVQDQDPIEIGPFCFRLDLGDNGGSRPAGSARAIFIVGHSRRECGDRRPLRIRAGYQA